MAKKRENSNAGPEATTESVKETEVVQETPNLDESEPAADPGPDTPAAATDAQPDADETTGFATPADDGLGAASTEAMPDALETEALEDDADHDADLIGSPFAARSEPEPEPAVPGAVSLSHDATPAAVTPPPARGPGIGGMILGGLIAGAIGFAAAWFLPTPPPVIGPDPVLDDRIASIEAEVATLTGAPPPAPFDAAGLETRQGDIEARADALEGGLRGEIANVAARIDDLGARIDALEARPVFEAGDTEAAMNEQLAAFEKIVAEAGAAARAELDTLRADAEAMRAEAEAMQEQAIAATETADRRAALADLAAALDSGAPYGDALAALGDVPAPLASQAETGVPSVAELRQAFPEAARAALAAAVTETAGDDGGTMNRFTSFLRQRTNARSLAPRDGADVDAILSRAESAVNSGDIDAALAELDALPTEPAAAMADWLDRARARAEATAAARNMIEG